LTYPSFSPNSGLHAFFLDLEVSASAHGKLATLHLPLILLQLSSLLLFRGEQSSVFALTRATLLDAAKGHDAQKQDEDAEGAGDDADFGALGECSPAIADARWGLDFLEDGGRVS
jgi:hypothetical protein